MNRLIKLIIVLVVGLTIFYGIAHFGGII